MSEDGLVAELDRIAERSELGAQCYLEELTRRELARQTTILLRLSWVIAVLTLVVILLAVAVALNS
jgi:thiamine monophosphate kinase